MAPTSRQEDAGDGETAAAVNEETMITSVPVVSVDEERAVVPDRRPSPEQPRSDLENGLWPRSGSNLLRGGRIRSRPAGGA